MPTIPQYRQQTSASQAGLGPSPESVGPNVFSAVAEGLSVVNERLEERAAVAANAEEMAARSHWMEQIEERKKSAEAGAEGFTDSVLKDYDADAMERVGKVRSRRAQAWLKDRLAQARLGVQQEAMGFEAASLGKLKLDGLTNGLDQARIAADFRPDDYDEILEGQLTAIAASGLPADARVQMAGQAKSVVAAAAVNGLIRRDPALALKELNSAPGKSGASSVEALDPDDRLRMRSAAESEIRRRDAEARARQAEQRDSLRDELADAFAAKQVGIPAALPSKARFQAVYGADGAEQHKVASQRWAAYDIASEVALLPPQEAAERLAAMRPTEQEGAEDKLQAYQLGVQLYAEQRKRLEADPAAVLGQSDRTIQAAAQAMADNPSDPGAVDSYFRTMAAKQSVLGVEKPRLLSESQSQAIAGGLVFNPNAPKKRAETIAQMRDVYGKWLPQILQEVAPSLDGHARVLVNMAPEFATRLDTALAQKKDIEDSISSTAKTDITKALDAGLADFASSLSDNPDAGARVAEHREAAKLLAQDMVLRGSQPQDAAEAALNAVVNSNYEFRGQGGNAPLLRVPVGIDADAVQSGALNQRTRLARDKDLAVTPTRNSTPEDALKDLQSAIRRSGYWVVNEDESGLVLKIPHRTGQGIVRHKDGSAVQMTWQQLQEVAPSEVDLQSYLFRGPYE
jgi:hypothetical protein